MGGRPAAAAHYPPKLVAAILLGLREELQDLGKLSLHSVDVGVTGHEIDVEKTIYEHGGTDPDVTMERGTLHGDVAGNRYIDDVTGLELPEQLVIKARKEEIGFMHDFGVYEVVPRAASRGKKFISVRWSDVNKGDLRNLLVRSRLCGR